MNYKEKYLKYKLKYLNFKNKLLGGSAQTEEDIIRADIIKLDMDENGPEVATPGDASNASAYDPTAEATARVNRQERTAETESRQRGRIRSEWRKAAYVDPDEENNTRRRRQPEWYKVAYDRDEDNLNKRDDLEYDTEPVNNIKTKSFIPIATISFVLLILYNSLQ